MNTERSEILSQIKSMETQLLLARMDALDKEVRPSSHSFADLYGILRQEVSSTEQEIEAALYPIAR